jgi:hypothetical protein
MIWRQLHTCGKLLQPLNCTDLRRGLSPICALNSLQLLEAQKFLRMSALTSEAGTGLPKKKLAPDWHPRRRENRLTTCRQSSNFELSLCGLKRRKGEGQILIAYGRLPPVLREPTMRRLMASVLVLIAIIWLVIFFLPRPQPQLSRAVRTFDPHVRFFETLSEAEHVCGKNNISLVEHAPPTGRFVCSDDRWR